MLKLEIGNLIEAFQGSGEEWKSAHQNADTLKAGSAEETDMIRAGFLELTGFENETVEEIRKQLQI